MTEIITAHTVTLTPREYAETIGRPGCYTNFCARPAGDADPDYCNECIAALDAGEML